MTIEILWELEPKGRSNDVTMAGTVSESELFDLAMKGKIKPDTLVRIDGKITSAGEVRGIVFGQRPTPPPVSALFSEIPADDLENLALQTILEDGVVQQDKRQHQVKPPPLPATPKDQCPRCYGYAWNGHRCKQCGHEVMKPELSSKVIEILVDGQIVNRVTVDELYTLAAEGTIDPETIVRIRGKLSEAGQLNGIVFERQLRAKKQEAERQERLRLHREEQKRDEQQLSQSENVLEEKSQKKTNWQETLVGWLLWIIIVVGGNILYIANRPSPNQSVQVASTPQSVPSNAPKQSPSPVHPTPSEGLDVTRLRITAEQGMPEAQRVLAECYLGLYENVNIEKNEKEAIKWYRRAGENGDAEARLFLALYYSEGDNKNPDEAKYWSEQWATPIAKQTVKELLHERAEQGDLGTILDLANNYQHGIGDFEKNEREAVKWFHKAAELGDSDAQMIIGVCYFDGKNGIQRNEQEAVKWFYKSAIQNNGDAQFSLSSCYSAGRGIEKDLTECLKWLRRSAANGNQDAKDLLRQMRN